MVNDWFMSVECVTAPGAIRATEAMASGVVTTKGAPYVMVAGALVTTVCNDSGTLLKGLDAVSG